MKPHYWDRKKERNLKLHALFSKHKDLVAVAKMMGMKIAATRNALKKMGEKFPKTALRKTSACHKNSRIVFQMNQEGRSLGEIARHIGTMRKCVKRFLREHGETRDFRIPIRGKLHFAWKGGRHIDKDGYVSVYCPSHPNVRKWSPYVLEHRLVMEKKIGRYLLRNEVVHHRDGNKQNNHPDNLQLFSENSEHLAFELKGRCPKWTPDGLHRIKKGIAQSAKIRRERIQNRKAQHAQV